MMSEIETEKAKLLNQAEINIIIPECCREGWATCIHVPKPQRKERINKGV